MTSWTYCWYIYFIASQCELNFKGLKMKISILLSVLLIPTTFFGAALEQNQIPNTFNGVVITAETLYDLMPQLPDTDRIALENWLATPDAQTTLSQLIPFNAFPDWRAKMQADKDLLQAKDMQNTSQWNYVFKLPKQEFVVKISGPLNRLQSILMAHGFWPGETPTKPIGKTNTYQTASRAAYYLILKEFIEKNKFKHIHAPETYLISYSKKPKLIDDEQVFILQRAIPAASKKITPELAQALPDDAISEIVKAIIGAGLWSIKDNLFLDTETNSPLERIHLVDLEQPNNSAPADFFHKDATRYYGNLRAGLEEFINLFAGNPAKLALVRTLIETSPTFNSPNFNQRYKNELIGALNAKAPQPLAEAKNEVSQ